MTTMWEWGATADEKVDALVAHLEKLEERLADLEAVMDEIKAAVNYAEDCDGQA